MINDNQLTDTTPTTYWVIPGSNPDDWCTHPGGTPDRFKLGLPCYACNNTPSDDYPPPPDGYLTVQGYGVYTGAETPYSLVLDDYPETDDGWEVVVVFADRAIALDYAKWLIQGGD